MTFVLFWYLFNVVDDFVRFYNLRIDTVGLTRAAQDIEKFRVS